VFARTCAAFCVCVCVCVKLVAEQRAFKAQGEKSRYPGSSA